MKLKVLTVAALALAVATPLAMARDTRHRFPIAEALGTADAKARVNQQVRLFWGNQSHPKPAQSFGTVRTNKKTNFFNKSDKEGCEWVFLSAVLALQERAVKEGGNAVINIKSIYRDQEFVSATEYECGAGAVVGGVAFEGEIVRLP